MTKAEKRKEWEARVAAFRASGQSATSWCVAHDLKPRQLWYWLHKIEPIDKPSVTPTQWISMEVGDPEPTDKGSGLLVRVGHVAIEVQPGFNPTLLKEVVQTLAMLC